MKSNTLAAAMILASISTSQARIRSGHEKKLKHDKLVTASSIAMSMSMPAADESVALASSGEDGDEEKQEKLEHMTEANVRHINYASKAGKKSDKEIGIGLQHVESYYYTRTLDLDQTVVIFDEGPLKIEANCEQDEVNMFLTLFNPTEDMLVYGDIDMDAGGSDDGLNEPPIGVNKFQVLAKGIKYTNVMWDVSYSGNNVDTGAVKLLTLNTRKSYYVGWDGESFIGIQNEEGLEGGGACALSGIFHVIFPKS